MGRIKQIIRTTYRKSDTITDSKGRKHCGSCGAYLGNRGRNSAKTRVYKTRSK